MRRKTDTIEKYEGGNEYIDYLIEDESWFIINGEYGRRPVQAETEAEAWVEYERFAK